MDDELFIKGVFADRYEAGESPDYSLPPNPLPDVGKASMPLQNGFMKALEKQRDGR